MRGAEDNIQVVYPTTPAQCFHMMRRQVLRKWRKPLIVMSPKSLLRHLECVSSLEELAEGSWQRIIPDSHVNENREINKVMLCTGKIYYELDKERDARGASDVAILRVEQLYPLRDSQIMEALAPYKEGTKVVWVQEEPENMGAWRHITYNHGEAIRSKFNWSFSSRPASASPATGSGSSHRKEQEILIGKAFDR